MTEPKPPGAADAPLEPTPATPAFDEIFGPFGGPPFEPLPGPATGGEEGETDSD